MKQNNWTTSCTQNETERTREALNLTGKCDWKRDRKLSTWRMRRRFAKVLAVMSSPIDNLLIRFPVQYRELARKLWSDLAPLGRPHRIGWENNEQTKLTIETSPKANWLRASLGNFLFPNTSLFEDISHWIIFWIIFYQICKKIREGLVGQVYIFILKERNLLIY